MNVEYMKKLADEYDRKIHTYTAQKYFLNYYEGLENYVREIKEQPQTIYEVETSKDYSKPLISVIVPTRNRKKMLSRAVKSVLNQNYSQVEIIIINDCSTDDTFEYLTKLSEEQENVKVINNNSNSNAGYNRRIGYQEANGEYIIFLDDDDFYLDYEFFSKAIDLHFKYKNISFVSGNAFIENIENKNLTIDKLNVIEVMDRDEYLNGFQLKYDKPHSTFTSVFKKEYLDDLDFNNMLMMNDSSIYLRALLTHDAYIMDDIVGVYVIHDSNISKGLNTDFVLMNLDEKKWVLNQAHERNLELDKTWFSSQILLTLNYFISGSTPNFTDMLKIFRWINVNLDNNKTIVTIKTLKYYIS